MGGREQHGTVLAARANGGTNLFALFVASSVHYDRYRVALLRRTQLGSISEFQPLLLTAARNRA